MFFSLAAVALMAPPASAAWCPERILRLLGILKGATSPASQGNATVVAATSKDYDSLKAAWDAYKQARAAHGGDPLGGLHRASVTVASSSPSSIPSTLPAIEVGLSETLRLLSRMDVESRGFRTEMLQRGIESKELESLKLAAKRVLPAVATIEALQQSPVVTELGTRYRVLGDFLAFDPERHATGATSTRNESNGFVHAPHSGPGAWNNDRYLAPGPHLIGKPARIAMYFSHHGTKIVEGLILGGVNGRWETCAMLETNTGEKILVPTRRPEGEPGAGTQHEFFIQPPTSISETAFRQTYAAFQVRTAGSYADMREVGNGDDTRAYLVNFGTHTEVVVGNGRFRYLENASTQNWIEIKNSLGTFFFPHRRLMAYTLSTVPVAQP